MRRALTIAHRWAGLITAAFLAVAALTGSVLAFEDELESALNPHLFLVTPPVDAEGHTRPMLHPLDLRERAESALPDYLIRSVRFHREAGQSQTFALRAKPGSAGTATEAFFDPYTGELLGIREYGESLFRRETLVGWLFHFHYTLAIPGPWGKWLFGIIALVWTLDCFIGFVLTWPRGRPFFEKWGIAWRIKRGAAPARLNLDIHRAFGLWLWALLLIYAWSSVMLNLRQEVYRPVMSTLFRFAELPDTKRLARPLNAPALDWAAAEKTGRAAMLTLARDKGFEIYYFDLLSYNPNAGFYAFSANTSRDIVRDRGQTTVYFDGNTGKLLASRIQTGEASGDTISRWLQSLHMAQIWGLPYQIFVAAMGLIITMLSVTGVVVWWHKRRARTATVHSSIRAGRRARATYHNPAVPCPPRAAASIFGHTDGS